MKLSTRVRQYLRLQSASFTVLFLAVVALAAWASTRYTAQADWTYGNRNTLSEPSRELLDQLDGTVTFEAFAADTEQVRERIRDIAQRYTRASDKVDLTFTDPRTHPQKVRELGIQRRGTILVRYQGRTAKVSQYKEAELTNAIKRLADTSTTRIAFLQGHGERPVSGRSRVGLTAFKRSLSDQGYATRTLRLSQKRRVPSDVSVLVVADPRQKLLPAERERIRAFLKRGGNLLWLADTGGQPLPKLDGKRLVNLKAGMIASPVQVLGARSRAFGVVDSYPGSAITEGFGKTTVFPKARPIAAKGGDAWESTDFLVTSKRSWADTGNFDPAFDKGEDRKGPITLGVRLTRSLDGGDKSASASGAKAETDGVVEAAASGSAGGDAQNGVAANGSTAGKPGGETGGSREQRVVVIGDADFMANGFIGFGGNQELAMKTVKWLSGDTAYLDISTPQPPDQDLNLSPTALVVLQALFMGGLPVAFLALGGWTFLRQRNR